MCLRQISKLYKTVIVCILYLFVYVLVSYAVTPEATVTFVSEDVRIGDRYAFVYLVAPRTPPFSDVEGAAAVGACATGDCFVTNNRGFLPLNEYDAILILGDERLLTEASAFTEAGRKYLIDTTEDCVRSKLKGCAEEPKITSFVTRSTYNLCSLCEYLHMKKLPKQ